MENEDIGNEYLEIFDSLDISSASHRRVGVYCLVEFHRALMTRIGRERVRADIGIHQLNLTSQWGQLLAWIPHDPQDEQVEWFDSSVRMLKQMRNQVAHNQLEQVEKERLGELRETGEDWREWLITQSNPPNEAYSTKEVMNAKVRQNLELIENIIENLRQEDISQDERYDLEDLEIPYDLCAHRFEQLSEDDSNEITPDLVELLMMSYDVRLQFEELQKEIELSAPNED